MFWGEERMSYNVFVDSSIYNFGANTFNILQEELNKVENPQWETDETLDIHIKEDFDMRHIKAVLIARDRDWVENHKRIWEDEVENYKQRVREAIEKFEKNLDNDEDNIGWSLRNLKKELGLQ